MKEILDRIEEWLSRGDSVALATLVGARGSSPREPGAVMAVNEAGEVLGSISGGCVEGAVVEEALAAIADSQPRLTTYGITDELGLSVGLTCGGTIQVFVESLATHNLEKNNNNHIPISAVLDAIRKASEKPAAICTMVEGALAGAKIIVAEDAPKIGSFGNSELDRVVERDARGLLAQGLKDLCNYGPNGERRETEVTVFIESFSPPPHLIIFGAVDFTRSLSKLGKMLGYRVTVCDARSRFATKARFPEADQVIAEWPHKYLDVAPIDHRTIIAVLTHDPKFDVPALVRAVQTPAAYIGAMGSRRAHADRVRRLQEAGLNETEIARISAPIGLDLGGTTSEETAVSIMAEVIALKNGRTGQRLCENQNPIHKV
ncbi:MAG: XdhC family protein [Oscillatoria sp. SIO1A7]|nr:XdhC family protein [Oscillatoria sp. SIO1A7]